MDSQVVKRPPKRSENRIILQFDYDCFYAQVFENKTPELKARPLGVKQKNLLATCNYPARHRGVKKLMLISEARRICPELVLVDGEDLTLFRDTSKVLFNFLRSHVWSGKAERLGFDEVFLDVTDVIDYNLSCVNLTSLGNSFFYLSNKDPELGFACDLTSVAGCLRGVSVENMDATNPAYLRLCLGSHLAQYLRLKLEKEFGYTSTCGISTNKVLSKLVGSKNKPRNQTTLLALTDDDILAFMDEHELRAIPGLGSKTTHLLELHIMPCDSMDHALTAREVRLHPTISPASLESLLGGPGAERGIGTRIWNLLHGVDPTEVKEANDIPSQISIEDTYKGLDTLARITEQLHKLSYSLIRRMRVDLVVADENSKIPRGQRWIARPKTLRLSIRSWPRPNDPPSQNFHRTSRSGPLPTFVFDLEADIDGLAQQLVAEALLPLLRRLQPEKGHGWNLQLINICVANMVAGAADDKTGVGRDIAAMFRRQDEVLRPWRVTAVADDEEDASGDPWRREDEGKDTNEEEEEAEEEDQDDETSWQATANSVCAMCGHSIPSFALPAHMRYHELGS